MSKHHAQQSNCEHRQITQDIQETIPIGVFRKLVRSVDQDPRPDHGYWKFSRELGRGGFGGVMLWIRADSIIYEIMAESCL